MLEFRLLGTLEIRDGERVVDMRRRKQRALLAALSLRAGYPVSVDSLIDDMWGENPPKTARHALESYISELRKIVGRDVIATHPGGYLLDVGPDQVDVFRFERLVAEARTADAARRAELLEEALSLFRGRPLADLAFEPFAAAEIARLEGLELAARENLIDAQLELGRHTDVVPVIEPLVAAHPYRERLRAQLMVALYRGGRQADALAAYQDARRALVEDLGIEPGEELQELERAILRHDPELRSPRRETAHVDRLPEPAPPSRPARKVVTITLVALSNGAELAKRLDPEALRAVLDRHLHVARSAIERHGGTCRQTAGGDVLAVFGAPATHEDDALRAVRAAVETREGVGILNDGLIAEHAVFLELCTAVTTGEVLVTPDGETLATGRPIALAEELVHGARPGQILLDSGTFGLVGNVVGVEETRPPPDAEAGAKSAFRLVDLRVDTYGRELRLDSALVGRRRQLAALAGAFESVAADRVGHVFTVLGAAGVGKSRLVHEFVDGLGDVATVRRGRCLQHGDAVTYWPLFEALPELPALGKGGEDVFRSARDALTRLAAVRPLVVVFDDLHWADPAFLDLVGRLAASTRDTAVLLLNCARPELLDDRPAWGGGKLNATSLLLEPLSEAESERLMDNLLGESDLPGAVRDHILRTAEGNPLFVEELLAALVDRSVLRRERGRWTTTEGPAVLLPATIQAVIAARIDRLPDAERLVLELASVEGRIFSRDAVFELAPEELRDDVDSHLAAVVRKELVRPDAVDAARLSFRHQLIRDVAYASMPLGVRAALHECLAGWLDAGDRASGGIVTYHVEQGRRYRSELGEA